LISASLTTDRGTLIIRRCATVLANKERTVPDDQEDTVKKIVLSSKVKRTYSGSVKVFANGGGGAR
jgi:hypothetical protein